jgi:hypothetical protein
VPPRKFDRYMVQIGMGTNPKLAPLTDSEFRAHAVGVLAIAAAAPYRGCLMVGAMRADAKHVALAAGVTERVAKTAMAKLCQAGVLSEDLELGCLRVHDWDDINPSPREDKTAADRQRRWRERNGTRNGVTNGSVTAGATHD